MDEEQNVDYDLMEHDVIMVTITLKEYRDLVAETNRLRTENKYLKKMVPNKLDEDMNINVTVTSLDSTNK